MRSSWAASLHLLVRTELLTPGPGPIPGVDANMYNQFFTLHGAIMVFLVIIPSIPAVFGNFVLPIMLGAKDVAFPRLEPVLLLPVGHSVPCLRSFRFWLVDLTPGWTFYTPYSTRTNGRRCDLCGESGVFLLGFSSIFHGHELHRHHPQTASAGNDLVQDAAVPCGRSTPQH